MISKSPISLGQKIVMDRRKKFRPIYNVLGLQKLVDDEPHSLGILSTYSKQHDKLAFEVRLVFCLFSGEQVMNQELSTFFHLHTKYAIKIRRVSIPPQAYDSQTVRESNVEAFKKCMR